MSAQIMIVEDDSDFRLLLTRFLSKAGYTVTEVTNLDVLRSHLPKPAPAVILLDLDLPDGNGLSLLPQIKKHWPATQVVILTGHGSVEAAERAYALSDLYLLSKPVELEMLQSIIELALLQHK